MINLKEKRFNRKILNFKLLLILLLILLLMGTLGWFIAGQREKTRTITYVIPPGTSQQLEAGQDTIDVPSEIVLTVGVRDTLVIENQDDVFHSFGPFVIGPHTTLTKRFKLARVYEGACTFHQTQQMKVVINPAPWDIW